MQLTRTSLSPIKNLRKRLGYLKPTAYGKKLGIISRKPKKISLVNLLLSYWLLLSNNGYSYRGWATELGKLIKDTVSSQAIWKRVDSEMVSFVKGLLNKSLKQKCAPFMDTKVFEAFGNVQIQDATHFYLPREAAGYFPGSGGKGEGTAQAKIQAVFNLKKGKYTDFELRSYRDNDQGDSSRFVKKLKKNDLILRDLGYSTFAAFNQIKAKKAWFLSLYKPGTIVFDVESGERISLLKQLKKKNFLDMEVMIGANKELSCRLVAIPLPEEIANEKRRKAKKARHKDAKHSDEYMQLLGYNIYITNVSQEIWTIKDIVKAYGCRWYIEILFKGWKSHLQIKMTIPGRYINKYRIQFLFYAALLMITLLVIPFFIYLQNRVCPKGRQVSILKICDFIHSCLETILLDRDEHWVIEQAISKCLYDIRHDRKNSIQKMYEVF